MKDVREAPKKRMAQAAGEAAMTKEEANKVAQKHGYSRNAVDMFVALGMLKLDEPMSVSEEFIQAVYSLPLDFKLPRKPAPIFRNWQHLGSHFCRRWLRKPTSGVFFTCYALLWLGGAVIIFYQTEHLPFLAVALWNMLFITLNLIGITIATSRREQ